MQFSMIATVLAVITTLVSSSAVSNVTLKWVGPTSKGVNVTIYGNAQDVTAQLKVIDPEWIPLAQTNISQVLV